MPSVEDPQDLLHLPDNLRPRKVWLVAVWWEFCRIMELQWWVGGAGSPSAPPFLCMTGECRSPWPGQRPVVLAMP